jgi:hypothetical protein
MLATGTAQRTASRSMCCRITWAERECTVVEWEAGSWKVRVARVTTRENITTLTNAQRHHGTERTAAFVVPALPRFISG